MVLTPERGFVRMLRGALIGSVASLLGVGLHAAAHGATGALGSFFAAMPVALGVGVALANRQYTFWRAWLVLLALQPVIHLVANSTAHASHDTATVGATVDGRMLGAHVLAAALAAAWVTIGDRVLWQWIGSMCRRLTVGVWSPVFPELNELIHWASRELVVATERILQSASRRGPPSAVALRTL